MFKVDVQSLSRITKKPTTDEKKNLSKHHLILPNNTQICVETLLSQCISEEQNDRKIDTKLRTRLKKKRVALFKPKNFILKNEKLRPIVTTNIKSGVFRSACSVEVSSQKKRSSAAIAPSNVLYSQSTLPSRIQTLSDFCNDKWIVQRTTQYMPNDWTRPLALTSAVRQYKGSINVGDSREKTKPKDGFNRTVRSRATDTENYEQIRKSTIHRLVTPEGFQLCISKKSIRRSDPSHVGISEEFKQPLQQQFLNDQTIQQPNEHVENVEVMPVPRTRFSRATRSPLKSNNVQFSTLPIVYCPEKSIPEGSIDDSFAEKVTGTKNGPGDKNRCRTCHKVYLGRRKVVRHLKAFPEHDMPIPMQKVKTTDSKTRTRTSIPSITHQSSDRLFDFLIHKIRNAPSDEKSHILFREISDFVEKLEAIRSLLLCDDNTHSSVEYLDKHCSKIFGTQEGNYHISLDILDQLASGVDPTEFANNSANDANILLNQIDHNINGSLSSISESKIHLVDGISEESLLKTVDDLMRKEGRMSDGNFDHIDNDNAVEAVTLKATQPILNLSLDLFKFDGT